MACPRKISFRMKSLKVFLDTEGKYDKSCTYEEGIAEIEKCEALLEHIMENGVTFVEPKFL